MSLQAIQQEMQQEARIDKAINSIVKRFLKQKQNNKYRIVSTREECTAMLIFIRSNLSAYSFILNDDKIDSYVSNDRITIIYLKNKNPHDSKKATIGDIKNVASVKKFYS